MNRLLDSVHILRFSTKTMDSSTKFLRPATTRMKLHRTDYLQVAPLKNNSIQLLPAKGAKQQQKMIVGDQRGMLQLISIRKSDPCVDFKVDLGSAVNCVTVLANTSESAVEMIVAATVQTIQGFSLKGKLIFTMETNLVEPIQHLWMASREEVIVANSYVYNYYHDGKEANYFLSTDRINTMAVLPLNKVPSMTPLLGCQDGTIYSLRDSTIRHRLPLDSTPTAIQLFHNDGGSSGEWVLYGTSLGQIGLVRWSRAGPDVRWIMQLSSQTSVTSLDFYDVCHSGVSQLIVGREDGYVEVYQVAAEEEDKRGPNLIFSQNCHDSIAAVRGGIVGAAGFPEILVATQRGWIFGLSSCESSPRRKPTDQVTAARTDAQNVERRKQLQHLKAEIAALEKQLADTQIKSSASLTVPEAISSAPLTSVMAKINFVTEENAHLISVESQVSINFILIHCDTDAQLMDIERNLAILSIINCEKNSAPQLTATFRCQSNTTRLEMKLLCVERSTSDLVRLYISPSIQHEKFAVLKSFRLVCLCRHIRCQPVQWDASTPHSSLTLRGGFSQTDAHNWIVACLPNVPEKVPAEEEINFHFRNEQWGTTLTVSYKKGEILFFSDNVAALSHVRDFISREATAKNLPLSINANVNWPATIQVLRRVHPQLMNLIRQSQQSILAAALEEAFTDQLALDGNRDWMTPEFRNVLLTKKDAPSSFNSQHSIEDYQKFLLELFASHREFLGEREVRSSHKFSLLSSMLTDSESTEAVVELFSSDDLSTFL